MGDGLLETAKIFDGLPEPTDTIGWRTVVQTMEFRWLKTKDETKVNPKECLWNGQLFVELQQKFIVFTAAGDTEEWRAVPVVTEG